MRWGPCVSRPPLLAGNFAFSIAWATPMSHGFSDSTAMLTSPAPSESTPISWRWSSPQVGPGIGACAYQKRRISQVAASQWYGSANVLSPEHSVDWPVIDQVARATLRETKSIERRFLWASFRG